MSFDAIKFQNDHRLWPRIQLIFWGVIVYRVTDWFLLQDDISTGQGAVIATMYGAAATYGKWYGDTDPCNKPVVSIKGD